MILVPEWMYGYNPVFHGLIGTLFTWAVTAIGAAMVFIIPDGLSEATEGKLVDAGIGSAAGIMLAASYWSLLAPSIKVAEESGYGSSSFFPAASGFILGGLLLYLGDICFSPTIDTEDIAIEHQKASMSADDFTNEKQAKHADGEFRARKRASKRGQPVSSQQLVNSQEKKNDAQRPTSWRRIMLFVAAVTMHNFPEGMTVGIGFGAASATNVTTLRNAELLAVSIALQNFPEGLAVSLPLRRLGYSRRKCFFYGQLSGLVEPIGGILGAGAIYYTKPILPYALSFAAGAMVYVVIDAILPEARARGNSKLATWSAMFGFMFMMILDVAFG